MLNLTELHATNTTSQKNLSVIIKVCVVVPFFCVFLFCIAIMLHIFATHRDYMETSRYILFTCMLVNDTLQIMSSVLLFLLIMGQVRIALVCCIPLLFISIATFQNTPLILATMSLERYVAIFYPLQRPAAWRSNRIWIIILTLWIISSALPIINFSIGQRNTVEDLSTPLICHPAGVNPSPLQALSQAAAGILFFTVVAVVILFTYVRIILETRKMRQDSASVNKGMYTVLLHGFQLLLCMLALTHSITEKLTVLHTNWKQPDIAFFNYFCFILIPRFLSPLIYGFRDQTLRQHIWRMFPHCSKKVNLCYKNCSNNFLQT